MIIKHCLTILALIAVAMTLTTPVHAKQLIRPVVESAVSRLQGVQQGNAILLAWHAVPGSDGYRIYHEQGDDLQPGSAWIDIDSSQNSYLYTDVTAGASYSFRVSPLAGKQEGIASALVTVTVQQAGAAKKSDTGK